MEGFNRAGFVPYQSPISGSLQNFFKFIGLFTTLLQSVIRKTAYTMSGIIEKAAIASKFRGALIGGLIGDCLGAPFIHDKPVSKVILQRYFDKMEDPKFKSPVKSYTDDTSMTKAVAKSLIQNKGLNEEDIAKRFVGSYFSAKINRSFGEDANEVFRALRNSNYQNIWLPAQQLFHGEGSYGSGGAMRITPIALFWHSNYDLMLSNAEKSTKITHAHQLGVNGALLQAIAVNQSFYHPRDSLNVEKFVADLIDKMAKLENIKTKNKYVEENNPTPFESRLKEIKSLLKKEEVTDSEVVSRLGNGEEALNSVPTAIYCFLRSEKTIKTVQTENKFRRAVQYSISLGGDTDTIAAMTGAISGAYYGYEYIDKNIQNHCEYIKKIIDMADQLYEASPK